MGDNESRGLASEYRLLHLFLVEPLIVLYECLDKHHSFLGGLHISQSILILYELGGNVFFSVVHQIVPIITVIFDMLTKPLEGGYAEDISYTTDI